MRCVRSFGDLVEPAARDRAVVTSLMPGRESLYEHLPRQFVRSLEGGLLEVAGGEKTEGLRKGGNRKGAVGLCRLVEGICEDGSDSLLDRRVQGGFVGNVDAAVSSHGNGFEVLRPHDGAWTAAGGRAGAVADDGGKPDQVLAGRSDARHLGGLLLYVLTDQVVRLPGALPPEGPRIADLDPVVVDPQVDGVLRLSRDDDVVIPGHLQLRCPVAAAVGVPEDTGEGRLEGDG